MNVFEVMASKLEEELTQLKEFLSSGKCEDFGGYASVCGQIRGLKTALHINNDLAKRHMEADDD